MSADNGVYIAEFPTTTGGKEWRVSHCQNIEDCDDPELGEACLVLKFGQSEVHANYTEAEKKAFELEKKILSDNMCPILEHGVQDLQFDKPFPTMTEEEADRKIEESFKGLREKHI